MPTVGVAFPDGGEVRASPVGTAAGGVPPRRRPGGTATIALREGSFHASSDDREPSESAIDGLRLIASESGTDDTLAASDTSTTTSSVVVEEGTTSTTTTTTTGPSAADVPPTTTPAPQALTPPASSSASVSAAGGLWLVPPDGSTTVLPGTGRRYRGQVEVGGSTLGGLLARRPPGRGGLSEGHGRGARPVMAAGVAPGPGHRLPHLRPPRYPPRRHPVRRRPVPGVPGGGRRVPGHGRGGSGVRRPGPDLRRRAGLDRVLGQCRRRHRDPSGRFRHRRRRLSLPSVGAVRGVEPADVVEVDRLGRPRSSSRVPGTRRGGVRRRSRPVRTGPGGGARRRGRVAGSGRPPSRLRARPRLDALLHPHRGRAQRLHQSRPGRLRSRLRPTRSRRSRPCERWPSAPTDRRGHPPSMWSVRSSSSWPRPASGSRAGATVGAPTTEGLRR